MKKYVLRLCVPQSLSVFFAMCLMFFGTMANAQSSSVSGTVTDTSGAAIAGATVTVKNTKTAVLTDAGGKFSINAPANAVLLISYVGLQTRQITVGNQSVINVSLGASTDPLEDVVVVAYGSVRKKDL